jgi:hypothetical protein
MKQFISLLGYEFRLRWIWIFMPLIYFVFLTPAFRLQENVMFALRLIPGLFFIFQLPIMLATIFQNRPFGARGSSMGGLEFSFSQAIDRTKLFLSKAIIYLFASLFFGVSYLVFAVSHPSIKLELPYYPAQRVIATRTFYLEHFKDARLEKDAEDKEGNKYYVILPHAQIAVALGILALSLICAPIFQLLLSLLPETSFVVFIIFGSSFFICIAMFPLLGGTQWDVSPYELAVAWIGQNVLWTCLILAVITIVIELVCCRRFVRKEIL